MVQRVNLDAMIRREDFAREIKGAAAPSTPSIIRELKLSDLLPTAAIPRQLRKPEFQRETNHWTHDQVLKLLTSFVDGDVIPSIILWRSPTPTTRTRHHRAHTFAYSWLRAAAPQRACRSGVFAAVD